MQVLSHSCAMKIQLQYALSGAPTVQNGNIVSEIANKCKLSKEEALSPLLRYLTRTWTPGFCSLDKWLSFKLQQNRWEMHSFNQCLVNVSKQINLLALTSTRPGYFFICKLSSVQRSEDSGSIIKHLQICWGRSSESRLLLKLP